MYPQHSQKGFTLIELLIAMALMSVITYACIWVFQQSMDLYSKSVGRGEVNQNMRVAEEKLRKDFLSCLSLDSGEQRFIMISRYANDPQFGKNFPRDFLSFATMARVDGALTQAIVTYDIVETRSRMPILKRYYQSIADINDGGTNIKREVVAQYCTEFKVEYLWQDPRPFGKGGLSNDPAEKNIMDPGIFLSLHPAINELAAGKNIVTKYNTGGLNGANILQDEEGGTPGAHAGGALVVQHDLIQSSVYGYGGINAANGIVICRSDTDDGVERVWGPPSMMIKQGSDPTTYQAVSNMPTDTDGNYIRIIYIRSPNLYGESNFRSASAEPIDLTADFTTDSGNWVTDTNASTSFTGYASDNPATERWPTYVPSMLRITLKIYNADRKIVNTRSFNFNISTAGR